MTTVRLEWPHVTVDVPALWLRDNCPCSDCRIEATTEHRLVIGTLPADLVPISVVCGTDGNIDVDWGDHRSHLTPAWWDSILATVHREFPEHTPWSERFTPKRFDFAAITGGDLATELSLLTAFATDGAVIATNTPTDPGYCEKFIRRWAPPIEVPFALIHDVYVDPAGYNVAHTAEALPPHNDMGSKRQPPSGQILHMLVNEAEGGDSVLVDGFGIAAKLSPEDAELLARVPASFRQFSQTAETWARSPILKFDCAGRLTHLRFSNQLLQPLDPADPETGDWYQAYHRLSALIVDEANQIQFRLDGGDLLMVHNHRVLHARRSFKPSSGARHLQDIYFDADDLLNEAWRLEQGH